MPILYCLSRVKNESDILELFIRYNARFFDRMFIIDNGSTDGSADILRKLADEGLPIEWWVDALPRHNQGEKMTEAYRRLAAGHAFDYLFLLDADEFVRAKDRTEVESALARHADADILFMPWQMYVWTGPRDPDADLFATIRMRRRVEWDPYFKAVLHHSRDRAQEWTIHQGNHDVGSPRDLVKRTLDLPLAHFPVRSKEQWLSKGVCIWLAYLAWDPEIRGKGMGFQHRILFEMVEKNGGIDDATVRALSYFYSTEAMKSIDPRSEAGMDLLEDPLDWPGALRYGRHGQPAMAKVLSSAEAIIDGFWAKTAALNARVTDLEQDSAAGAEALANVTRAHDEAAGRLREIQGSRLWRFLNAFRALRP
jgi:hypothetical protein